MILPPTSEISHHHKVTNITVAVLVLSQKLPCLVRSLRSAEACLESQYSRIGLAQFGIQN